MKPKARSFRTRLTTAVVLSLAALLLLFGSSAYAFDPFFTNRKILRETQNRDLLDATKPDRCKYGPPANFISLLESIRRALCASPEVHDAWATVRGRAAQLGIADTAYLPTVTISGQTSPGFLTENVGGNTPYTFRTGSETTGVSADVNWVLFDFGFRGAGTEAAKQSLAASVAGLDATIQKVIEAAASAYYEVMTAQSALEAHNEALNTAAESLKIASEKYKLGAAPLSEKLQAETFYSRSQLDTQRAKAALASARGRLNVMMGVYVASEFGIEKSSISAAEISREFAPLEKMVADAERWHPALRSAKATLNAAEAKVSAAEAYDLPTVSLVANYSGSFQSGQFTEPDPATISQGTIGAKIIIPISGLIERSYRVQAAKADELASRAALEKTNQEIISDVWTSYQSLLLAKAEANTSETLLVSARHAYSAANGRYRAGLGNMLEVMTAQSALADAEQQQIAAVSDWFNAKVKLTASIGGLDLASVQ